MNKKNGKGNVVGIICLILGAGLIAGILFYFFGSKISNSGDVTYNFSQEAEDAADVSIRSVNSMSQDAPVPETPDTDADLDNEGENNGEDDNIDLEKQFFTYEVSTRIHNLRIRTEGSLSAKIIGWIPKGKTGYVYERGDGWSLVEYQGVVGYSSNDYLIFTEIPREELPESFPEEYR